MGKAYYGLELVGGNKSHLAPLQTTINKGIRLFTGARLSTAIGPLLVETGIESLLTRSLVSRILADTTSQTKDSQVTTLVCIDGDSTNMRRLCIAPKVCYSTILGHLGFKDPVSINREHMVTRYLMLARMDALWTARKAIRLAY
ncbi:hypothetical protein BASA83_011294 [Batrachochytrium salamandrivorans]|nr:hypothetical protein BASA83_011294 [Batrachochytrium salamandrivorans]